jgi:hypothetical protein
VRTKYQLQKHEPVCKKCFGPWFARTKAKRGKQNPRWQGGPPTVDCAWCGKTKETDASKIRRNKRHFCNRDHAAKWRSKHLRGDRLYNWKGDDALDIHRHIWLTREGGKEWRIAVRKRDSYTCQLCGWSRRRHGGRLHVHHKAGFATYPEYRSEIANGITLCKRCHHWSHRLASRAVLFCWELEALRELRDLTPIRA